MTDYYQFELDDLVIALNNKDADIEMLQKKLDIATKALKDALKDYEFNGPCENEEGCSGYYMADIIQKALKEIDEVMTAAKEEV